MAQYQEQVSDLKKELSDTRKTKSMMSFCNPKESDAFMNTTVADMDKLFFDVGLALKNLAVKASVTLVDILGAILCCHT